MGRSWSTPATRAIVFRHRTRAAGAVSDVAAVYLGVPAVAAGGLRHRGTLSDGGGGFDLEGITLKQIVKS